MNYYNLFTNSEQEQFISENHREKTKHGTPLFPCAVYLDLYYGNSCLWHWHDEMEIGYVHKGSLNVHVNDLCFTLHEGEGVFINTGVLHSYSGESGLKVAFPNILFLPSLVYGSEESIFWSEYLHPLSASVNLSYVILKHDVPWQSNILDKITQIMKEFEHAAFGYEFHIRSYLFEIILNIYRNNQIQIKEQVRNKTEIDRVCKMLSYIEGHYMNQIQIKQIADSAFISSRECLRIFQNVIGTSPKQYVIRLRIKKAKCLLSGTAMSISEISDCCGFQNQSYFTKTFREQLGITPAKYRKNNSSNSHI